MFRKPYDVAASARSVQRSKEAKDLREAIARLFPGALECKAALDEALPQKGLEAAKLSGSKCVAYGTAADHTPLVIDANPKSALTSIFPTVFLLWKCPSLLPTVVVHSPVSAFLINGADLMLPGVIVRPDATLPSGSTFPEFAEGALVAVRAAGNALPFAVGRAVMSTAAARGCGMRGRGVELLHCFRDELWVAGGRLVPNAGFLPSQVVPAGEEPLASLRGEAAAPASAGEAAGEARGGPETLGVEALTIGDGAEAGGGGGGGAAPSAPADPHLWWQAVSPDELLVATLLQALRRHVRPGDLPLLGSQLLGQAMAAARPAGSTLDVKHTRWRKFGAFLRAVGGGEEGDAGAAKSGSAAAAGGGDVLPGVRPEALRGLLSVEEDAARGTALVRAVNRDHPLLLAHRPWPATAEAGAAGSAPGRGGSSSDGGVGGAGDSAAPPYRPPTLHEWLQPTAAAAALCSYVALAALRARRRPLGSVAPVRGMWLYEPSLQHSGAVPTVEPDAPLPQEWRALARGAAAGRPPPVLYTRAQAAAVLQEYVTLRGLGAADRHSVVADDRLADALFGPGKGVRSHTGAAAPLSEALFPSLPSRGGHAEAAKDAWDDAGGDDGEEDSGDKSSEPPESGLPSQLDEPFVSHDPRSAVPKDDAARLWLQRLTPHYSISFPAAAAAASGGAAGGGTASCVGADVVLKRGVPPTIRAYQRKLQGGRKHTTHIVGLAPYRLAPERVAREAARAFAAAGSTGPCATDPTVTEAVIQGEWGPQAVDLLAAPPPAGFGLPRKVLAWEGEGGGSGRMGR